MKQPGAVEGGPDVRQNVVLTDVLDKLRTVEHRARLFRGSTQKQSTSRSLQALCERLQRVEPGGINRRHVAKSQHYDRLE